MSFVELFWSSWLLMILVPMLMMALLIVGAVVLGAVLEVIGQIGDFFLRHRR